MLKNKIVILLVIIVLSLGLMGCVKTEEDWVIENTKTIVKNNLKSPSTAEFPNNDVFEVKEISDNIYRVVGYVDAENGFSAMIRTKFIIEIKQIKKEVYITNDVVFSD